MSTQPFKAALLALALAACGDEPAAPTAAAPEGGGAAAQATPDPAATPVEELPLPSEDEVGSVPIEVLQAVEEITPDNADSKLEELEMFIGADAMYYADNPPPADDGHEGHDH